MPEKTVAKKLVGKKRVVGKRVANGVVAKQGAKTLSGRARPPRGDAGSRKGAGSEAKPAKAETDRRRRRIAKGRAGTPADVIGRLAAAIPAPHVELDFSDPWQLLVAVILSAQSTDRRVNLVTPELFARWPNPAALALAPSADVEEIIRSTGFFRNKTKSIRGASQMLVDRFDGQVPRSMVELLLVPGVARKTANVVLGSAYAVAEGIVTDTHAMRVAQRLGLTSAEAPEKIEADLCRKFPRETWIKMGHRLVLHGRHVCTARAPKCPACPLNEICPSRLADAEGSWQERAQHEAEDMGERAIEFRRPGA